MISSLSWLPKGASKCKPLRYELSQRELEEIVRAQGLDARGGGNIEGGREDGEGTGDGESRTASGSGEVAAVEGTDDQELPPELRMDEYDDEPDVIVTGDANGGDSNDAMDEDSEGDEDEEQDEEAEDEDEVDDEVDDEEEGLGVSLVQEPGTGQVFAYESEDEDSDTEDNIIKPSDHVLLTTTTGEDEQSALEVHVYSEETGNLYVHHDIALPALPLCLSWMDMPPRIATATLGAAGQLEEGRAVGSYCAIGTFEPAIEIWNLDVLDPLEPTATLGGYKEKPKKAGKKPRKRQLVAGSHEDAVMALAWNREHRHVLASGSADNTVKVWDVTTQQCSVTLSHHQDKVQAVAWHPVEATVIASMGYDHRLALLDARAPSKVSMHKLEADPECLAWNPHRPMQIVTGSEDGVVCCRDVRSPATPVYSFTAHEGGVSSLSFTPLVSGMLATCSEDKTVRVWDVDAEAPLQVASKSMAVGRLFSVRYSASSAFLLATGGSKGHLALWHSDEDEAVSSRFSGRVVTDPALGGRAVAGATAQGTDTGAADGGGVVGGIIADVGEAVEDGAVGHHEDGDMEGVKGDGGDRSEDPSVEGSKSGGGAGKTTGKRKSKKNKKNKKM